VKVASVQKAPRRTRAREAAAVEEEEGKEEEKEEDKSEVRAYEFGVG